MEHKAKVLTIQEVIDNRSNAYEFLDLDKINVVDAEVVNGSDEDFN